jgi:hypothetical protein
VQHFSSAARHYTKALELQKGNIYAANGLGAVAGSLGQLDAARRILSQLRESAALASGFVEVPDVCFSLEGLLHLHTHSVILIFWVIHQFSQNCVILMQAATVFRVLPKFNLDLLSTLYKISKRVVSRVHHGILCLKG